jgi:Zn-dependent peptidase ImmA (M78 family)
MPPALQPGARKSSTSSTTAMSALSDGLYPATALYTAEERAERVADRFAAALLMPKLQIRRDWTDGLQEVGILARRYNVSRPAMEVRLRQLGLLAATPRCAAPAKEGTR